MHWTALYWLVLRDGALLGFLALFRIHRLWERHHLYWGLLLVPIPWWPSRLFALLLVLDEDYQHGWQMVESLAGVRLTPDFSPVHRLYVWAVERIQAWRA